MATQKKKAIPVVKKSTASKSILKKVGSSNKKGVVSKKPGEKKPLAKKTVLAKKQSSKPAGSAKKIAKPINKSSLAKKSAKPVVKKAIPKKLANNKTIVNKE